MMDPKLMAILKKAKAIDNATAQKNGESRKPTRGGTVNREYFDEPETNYLTEAPTHSAPSGGGLYDQLGVGGNETSTTVDRMDVNSHAYTDSVENSNLPAAIKEAMMSNPIPQPGGIDDIDPDFLNEINPRATQKSKTEVPQLPEVYNEGDEKDFFQHPIETTTSKREIPRTNQSNRINESVDSSDVRKMIAEEIAKALPIVIEQYFDKRVLKENVQFKAGNTTFSGTVAPLPKKRTKRK